jgi:hypothetical protein
MNLFARRDILKGLTRAVVRRTSFPIDIHNPAMRMSPKFRKRLLKMPSQNSRTALANDLPGGPLECGVEAPLWLPERPGLRPPPKSTTQQS